VEETGQFQAAADLPPTKLLVVSTLWSGVPVNPTAGLDIFRSLFKAPIQLNHLFSVDEMHLADSCSAGVRVTCRPD
jgi:hypothetical protein